MQSKEEIIMEYLFLTLMDLIYSIAFGIVTAHAEAGFQILIRSLCFCCCFCWAFLAGFNLRNFINEFKDKRDKKDKRD
jgi:hypothetical protein